MQIQLPAPLQTSCVKLDKSLHLSASGFICKIGMVCSCTHQLVVHEQGYIFQPVPQKGSSTNTLFAGSDTVIQVRSLH